MFSQHGRTWRAWIRSVGYVPTRVGGRLFAFFSSLPSSFLSSFLFGSSVVFSFFFSLLVWVPSFVIDYWGGGKGKNKNKNNGVWNLLFLSLSGFFVVLWVWFWMLVDWIVRTCM